MTRRLLAVVVASAVAVAAGCHREPTTTEGAVGLDRAFASGANPDAVRLGVAAIRSNDFAAGVIALQAAKQSPGLSAEQLAAIERASQAVTAELTRKADAGDPNAKAQLEAIERSRSQ